MLLALVSAQRCQTLHKLRIDKMSLKSNNVIFVIEDLIKTSRPGKVGQQIVLHSYPPDRRLCIKLLKHYIDRTKLIRNRQKHLFLSYVKPHVNVSKDTIARWLRMCMATAGVDVDQFKAHSVRAASVSAANKCHVPIQAILDKAGWTSERTFQKFYNKPIQNVQENDFNKILSMK